MKSYNQLYTEMITHNTARLVDKTGRDHTLHISRYSGKSGGFDYKSILKYVEDAISAYDQIKSNGGFPGVKPLEYERHLTRLAKVRQKSSASIEELLLKMSKWVIAGEIYKDALGDNIIAILAKYTIELDTMIWNWKYSEDEKRRVPKTEDEKRAWADIVYSVPL